jgi:hypothetical protein
MQNIPIDGFMTLSLGYVEELDYFRTTLGMLHQTLLVVNYLHCALSISNAVNN